MEDFEKKYNEALKRANAVIAVAANKEEAEGYAFTIFPELRESEDDRIRKWLVDYFGSIKETVWIHKDITCEQILEWLEKQKEQKPVKFDDDTEVGLDRALLIINKAKGNLCGYQSDDGIYECCHAIQTLERILNNGIERKPAECSEEHIADVFEKVGLSKIVREQGNDELTNAVQSAMIELSKGNSKEWSEYDKQWLSEVYFAIDHSMYSEVERQAMKKYINHLRSQSKPAEWSEEDKVMLNMIEYRLKDWDNIKAQQGYQDNYASQSPVKWIESLPERFNLQPKQGWSEEDEDKLKQCIRIVTNWEADYDVVKSPYSNFLKSLRPSWKPSEEQMEALQRAIDACESEWAYQDDELRSLATDLKKLKED